MTSFFKQHKDLLLHILVILLSTLILVIGVKLVHFTPAVGQDDAWTETAVVTSITDRITNSYQLSGEQGEFISTTIAFRARLTSGEFRDTEITAYQEQDTLLAANPEDIQPGDKVVLGFQQNGSGEFTWQFLEYYRVGELIWLGVAFLLLLILFGHKKGINTIISLIFTVLAVFLVFVPSILAGYNIYLSSSLTCLFCTVSTLLIVSGWSKKTLIACAGCIGGLLCTALLTLLMSELMHLTGLTDSNAIYLASLPDISIDLRAVIFGAILIGALGAVMDVSMSLSSSLLEVSEQMGGRRNLRGLFRSGMNIGRDMMGTMANTLILAYIGSSLSVVLLLISYESSLQSLFNREMIVVEVMQSLVGSMGILFAIPSTSLLAAWLYSKGTAAPVGRSEDKADA